MSSDVETARDWFDRHLGQDVAWGYTEPESPGATLTGHGTLDADGACYRIVGAAGFGPIMLDGSFRVRGSGSDIRLTHEKATLRVQCLGQESATT